MDDFDDFKKEFDFQNKKKIGQGSSGITYKIRNKQDGNYYLLKEIFFQSSEELKKEKNEAKL